jgi:hypothetical protein
MNATVPRHDRLLVFGSPILMSMVAGISSLVNLTHVVLEVIGCDVIHTQSAHRPASIFTRNVKSRQKDP